jgi:hypothetical protein
VPKRPFAKYLLLPAMLFASAAIFAQTVAPTYQNLVPPSGFAADAGEPSIGADWNSGKIIFQAGLETDRITINGVTATWEKVSPTTSSVATLDPIMFTDSTTGRVFVSQLAGACSLSSFSDNDGTSFTPVAGCGVPAGIDHQTIGGGPFAPSAVPHLPPPVGYQHAIYYCSQDIVDASCAVSLNGGLSFGVAVPIYSLLDCGGLHGHIKVGPDGTAYVPNKNCGSGNGTAAVVSSGNNGLTWTVHLIPGSSSGDSDPSVAIASDNTVYFGWQGANGHAMAAVSHDHGATWTNIADVGAALGIQNVAFTAMVAGDGNRAALAFLGTPTGGDAQDTAGFAGVWHVYIAHTYDGGATWTLADATPNDPVQRGSICLSGTSCGNDRNLLDFIDATVDKQGRVLVGYADGCIGPCVNAAPNSFTALGTIARQATGKGLFAAFDGTF